MRLWLIGSILFIGCISIGNVHTGASPNEPMQQVNKVSISHKESIDEDAGDFCNPPYDNIAGIHIFKVECLDVPVDRCHPPYYYDKSMVKQIRKGCAIE